ncbi:hypothetical protein KIKIMORA_01000 [Brevundimonas phage vB_BpoS-Kikimora]|uniref:Uncharacterized protein n=1 Tax=Brevundimonas phage vB_BpoS-Kikimora TaxID=2948601 RepID=A0A9E7MT83_9CAUD|nr:hypothetical protein KIKIMORA_01000 [Brevundimonas phage vB_BpoS-Kikimora]
MTRRLSFTTQAIGAVLSRGGLKRSTMKPAKVRGFLNVASGFRVRKGVDEGSVVVSWISNLGDDSDTIAQMLLRCEELLEDAGYAPERDAHGGGLRLIDTQEPLHILGIPNGTVC